MTSYLNNTCSHENFIEDNGIYVCTDCGEQLDKTNEESWKFEPDNKKLIFSDLSRISIRKPEEVNIYNDVKGMGFSENIINKANSFYKDFVSTNGEIYRGSRRKSIIYACIYFAFMSLNMPISSERLISIFNIDKQLASQGFKFLNLSTNENSVIRSPTISTKVIIEEIMDKFSASLEQKEKVYLLFDKIQNKSPELNRARPQSVACGLVFYWLSEVQKNEVITIKEFSKIVSQSSLTILNLSKVIEIILEKPKIFDYLNNFTFSKEQKESIFNIYTIIRRSPLIKKYIDLKTRPIEVVCSYWIYKNSGTKNKEFEKIFEPIEKYLSKEKNKSFSI